MKEEQRAVVRFFWAESVPEQKSIADFQHNMATVLYHSRVCMIGLPCLKTVTQLCVTDDKRSGRPSTSTTEVNIERVPA